MKFNILIFGLIIMTLGFASAPIIFVLLMWNLVSMVAVKIAITVIISGAFIFTIGKIINED